jgi:hypothetical protein
MDYIVEQVTGNGSTWSRYGRDSNQMQAIRMAENLVRSRRDVRVRVVDSKGNVVYSG